MKHEGYAKIDTSEFMAVSVELIGEIPGYGNVISIAHYGVQNGDLMADPRNDFRHCSGGTTIPSLSEMTI